MPKNRQKDLIHWTALDRYDTLKQKTKTQRLQRKWSFFIQVKMSIAGVGGNNQETNNEDDSVGHVAFRKNKNQSQNQPPFSWAVDEEQRIPIHSQQDEGLSNSFLRSPPRIGSQRSARRRGDSVLKNINSR